MFLLIYFIVAAFFSEAYYERYSRHINCFNDNGRRYEPATTTAYSTGGTVEGLFAAFFAMLTLLSVIHVIRHEPNPPKRIERAE